MEKVHTYRASRACMPGAALLVGKRDFALLCQKNTPAIEIQGPLGAVAAASVYFWRKLGGWLTERVRGGGGRYFQPKVRGIHVVSRLVTKTGRACTSS